MQIAYYPGCTLKSSAQQYESSALAVLKALEIEPQEMKDWNCCGVVHALASDDIIHHVAPTRVFTQLQQQGSANVVTFCDMCYNSLAQANIFLKQEPQKCETINEFLESEHKYQGQIEILHLLPFLRDKVGFETLKKKVKHPLKGLRLFPYYGCKLLRPREIGIDDAEDPTILADLMHALGAEVIDDPLKIQCCGSHHVVDQQDIVVRQVEKIILRVQERGADAVVLSCPLCMFNFDSKQKQLLAPLPIFYFTQLICIALGLEKEALGLHYHRTNPLPLLQERQFLQVKQENML